MNQCMLLKSEYICMCKCTPTPTWDCDFFERGVNGCNWQSSDNVMYCTSEAAQEDAAIAERLEEL